MSFRLAVSALVESIIRRRCRQGGCGPDDGHPECGGSDGASERVVRFVLQQHARMPDYLRLPLMALTVAFDAWSISSCGRFFHSLPHERRWRRVLAWKRSRFAFRRDLIRFYESLVIFGWYAEVYESPDR